MQIALAYIVGLNAHNDDMKIMGDGIEMNEVAKHQSHNLCSV
jgi:hypothetical protein